MKYILVASNGTEMDCTIYNTEIEPQNPLPEWLYFFHL